MLTSGFSQFLVLNPNFRGGRARFVPPADAHGMKCFQCAG